MDINKYNTEKDIKRIEKNVIEFLKTMWEISEEEDNNKDENE